MRGQGTFQITQKGGRWAVGSGHHAVGCTHSHPAEQRPAALAASISAHSVNTTCLLLTMHSSQALGWLLLLNTAGSSISRVNYHSEVVDACVPSAGPALTACSRVAMRWQAKMLVASDGMCGACRAASGLARQPAPGPGEVSFPGKESRGGVYHHKGWGLRARGLMDITSW